MKKNSWYLIISLFSGFFRALGESLRALWKGTSGLTQTHFMESLHFFFVVWPRQFWKKPSGLGIGRSFGSIIAFICTKERIFEQTRKPKGVTIIELIIALTLLSAVLIMAFTSFGNITVLRNLVTGRIDVNEQLYGAVERLVTTIKEGGGIDYEEYFNRNLIGSTLSGGHYQDFSGYGNYGRGGILGSSVFGSGGYICRSSTLTDIMNPTTGCITPSLNTQGLSQTGVFQRYGSYRAQFIDANSDASNDTALCVGRSIPGRERGDSDCNGKILGDEDDEDLGNGPAALQS